MRQREGGGSSREMRKAGGGTGRFLIREAGRGGRKGEWLFVW